MKKLYLLLSLFIILGTSGCTEKSVILFNKYPFAKESMLMGTNVFAPGEKIYYLVTLPKPVKSQRLLVQVIKIGKDGRLGYELEWGKQVKIRDEQIYYYDDYIVLNETGSYVMRVFSKDDPTKLLTSADFYVQDK